MNVPCALLRARSVRLRVAMLRLAVFGLLAASPLHAQTYALSVSTSSNHSSAVALNGAILSGNAYVFTSNAANLQNFDPSAVGKVCYWLDNTSATGTARHCESIAPYDFAGSVNNTASSLADPWNTTTVANGTHTITQVVTLSAGGSEVDIATFTIQNQNLTLSLSPTSLSFGSQAVGTTSSTQTVTLTNSGTGTVTFNTNGITISGDYGDASVCGATLVAGAQCTVVVTFAPTATGTRTGTLSISDNAAGSPQTATLSGTGTSSTGPTYALSVSTSSNHSNAVALNGAILSGNAYVFTSNAANLQNFDPSGASKVCYWLDNTFATGTARHCESVAPYDFAGSVNNTAGSLADPWNTTTVANGTHTITQVVTLSAGGSEVDIATFTIQNVPAPTATFSANPTTIPQGGSSTLSWSTTNATSVSINNGIGPVAASGSLAVQPAATTTYTLTATGLGGTATPSTTVTVGISTVSHYEYVLPDQNLYVYDMDNGFQLLQHVSIPQVQGVRGIGAVISTHMLYISYGQFGRNNVSVPGSLLKYDLLTNTVVWTQTYSFGIDSFDISPDGSTIYMPDGENSGNGTWFVIDAVTGNVKGSINSGWIGPHDTVVSLDGAFVYLCPHHSAELVEASTSTNSVVVQARLDLPEGPFTINGKHTLAFSTQTGLFGFQVIDTASGAVLFTVPVPGFTIPSGFSLDTPDHGISLSPDEKEIYLIDTANAFAHVFDVSGLPSIKPSLIASVPLTTRFTGTESPCLYDCTREGWIRHTLDGKYVLVGDSGNVISTSTRQVVGTLPQLDNTRVYVGIDWQNGLPVSTSTRQGKGYVTH